MVATALIGLAVVLAFMTLVWVGSVVKADASIVDPMWGLAFAVLLGTYVIREGTSDRAVLLLVLVGLWAGRLFGYLAWRKRGEPEDYRYQAMRDQADGSFAVRSLFVVFWPQGLLSWIISAPLLAAAHYGGDLGPLDVGAIVMWAVGLYFETVGDLQLARFKADPDSKGKVMDRGLWRYTRHPNYFGDGTVWWAYGLIALAAGGWWSLFGPLLMSVLLLKISGVALLEKKLESSREGYREYAQRTNALFPWRPRRGGS